MGKMVEIGNGIKVNASAVSYIEDNVVVLSNKHRYTAGENALKIIKTELVASKLKRAEILELACKIFADEFVGNKTFEAEGSSVTYNTDAVEQGDIYCASFYDGGFYVGARTEEDYEPKVGDWWTFSSKRQDIGYDNPQLKRTLFYKVCGFDFFVAFQDEKSRELLGGYRFIGKTCSRYISVTNKSYQDILSTKENDEDYLFPISASSHDGETVYFRTGASRNDNIKSEFGWDVENSRPIIYAFKPVTSSDILAYQATGHMGALFLGEAMDKSVEVSSKRLASETAIFIDNKAVPCTLVGGTLYITNTAVSGNITSAGDVYEVLKDNT